MRQIAPLTIACAMSVCSYAYGTVIVGSKSVIQIVGNTIWSSNDGRTGNVLSSCAFQDKGVVLPGSGVIQSQSNVSGELVHQADTYSPFYYCTSIYAQQTPNSGGNSPSGAGRAVAQQNTDSPVPIGKVLYGDPQTSTGDYQGPDRTICVTSEYQWKLDHYSVFMYIVNSIHGGPNWLTSFTYKDQDGYEQACGTFAAFATSPHVVSVTAYLMAVEVPR
jgi:hypothetical protein